MTDDDQHLEALLRAHFDDDLSITREALDTAASLFDLRRVDEELIELSEQMLAMRADGSGDGDAPPLRFEFGDIVVLVRPISDGIELIVTPPDAEVSIESVFGTDRIALDQAGTARVTTTGPLRLRIHRSDGSSGVTDGFTQPAPDAG
ncbi:MAG: hypothetical protein AB8G26_02580 [Ilumatobacter sp.]